MPLRQLKPDEARGKFHESMWDDPNWIAEYKYDGARYLMHLGSKHEELPRHRFTSRRKSVKDGLYVEKTLNFPLLNHFSIMPCLNGTVLDGEIILKDSVYDVLSVTGALPEKAIRTQIREGWVNYVIWDILFLGDKDVREEPWEKRRERIEGIIEGFDNPYISVSDMALYNKREYYEKILSEGGEGIILKKRDHKYGTKSWVKVKRAETFDVRIIGYKDPEKFSLKSNGVVSTTKFYDMGWIGAIEFEEIEGNGHGFCAGMTDKIREHISKYKASFIGTVFEIIAQEKLPSGSFRHPRFKRWRLDK